MTAALVVNGYSAGWLRKGFPWVYPKEVVRGGAAPGAPVELRDGQGQVLGRGIADRGALAVRVFRHGEGPLDDDWLDGVLGAAVMLREAVVEEGTTGYRLVHAENDGLPGLRVDRWGDWLVVVLDSVSLRAMAERVTAWLVDRFAPKGVVLCFRGAERPGPELAAGEAPSGPVEVLERGLRYGVAPLEGPDVGLYADMRPVRAWLEPHWAGTRLLNLFAYTAAFSVSAGCHGAAEAVSVDLSSSILERARDNFLRNGLDPDAHRFEAEDVFKALDRFRRKGERFDRVIVDPPSFSRGRAPFAAKKDWPRLAAAAVRVLVDGGWLLVASNQGELSPRAFDGLVAEGVRKAKAGAQLLLATGQGPDFPAATSFPEGRYLKVRLYRVLRD